MKGQTSQEELDKFEEALLKYGSLSPGGAEHLIEVAQRLFKENVALLAEATDLAEFYANKNHLKELCLEWETHIGTKTVDIDQGKLAAAFLEKWRPRDSTRP